jgi:multidrug efflux pump subunit AcrA (membrane-fusion protein)
MSDQAAHDSLVFRVEISPEQVPRLRDALTASGNDGELTRRAAEVARREEQLRAEQAELDERARKLSEREAELGTSDEMTASERIRLAQRRQSVELSEQELEAREGELYAREAEFEADVLLREERIERWRGELTALQELLERRERDLAAYVDQLQSAVTGGVASWPPPPGVSELRRTA